MLAKKRLPRGADGRCQSSRRETACELTTRTVLVVGYKEKPAESTAAPLERAEPNKVSRQHVAKCSFLRTGASKLRRHDPVFPEQRRPPLLIMCTFRVVTFTACPAKHDNGFHEMGRYESSQRFVEKLCFLRTFASKLSARPHVVRTEEVPVAYHLHGSSRYLHGAVLPNSTVASLKQAGHGQPVICSRWLLLRRN